MTRRRWRGRAVVATAIVLVTVVAMQLGSSASASESAARRETRPQYRVGTIFDGLGAWLTAPRSMPPAVNVPGCRPSPAHPNPVVLVHGTVANAAFTWQALAPQLANDGYCVYALNYGLSSLWPEYLSALADIATSAAELGDFVDSVLAETGADKVDIVGHSQGGMMPRYYIKNLGGAAKVGTMVGLSPSNHGTTLFGLNELLSIFKPAFDVVGCPACTQQILPSPFLDELNAGPDETVPGPRYVVIQTRYDEVVTPYTSAFLSGDRVRNITVQDACPTDYTEHIGIVYDPVALQYVREALGRNRRSFQPTCSFVWPVISG